MGDEVANTKTDTERKSIDRRASQPSTLQLERKGENERRIEPEGGLPPVIEVTEPVPAEVFDKPREWGQYVEDPPKLFNVLDNTQPLTIKSLNNAIYELGIINLCWPKIEDPVFETRTCFPMSYYTNTTKERLLLTYCECFRRQYHLRFNKHKSYRKGLLLQAPNECGLQKMVCTTISPTKLCYAGTNVWQGLASLVADYFTYEPLTQPMLHPPYIRSPYTALMRRSANVFEMCTVLVSWLLGATYDAYIVVGCADRDTCLNIRYRTECPDIPSDKPKKIDEDDEKPAEEPEKRYKLMPLPDFKSKYEKLMEHREKVQRAAELERLEKERQLKIKELESPPYDPVNGWRTHAWVLILPGPMNVIEPFFIEAVEGNIYPLSAKQFHQIDAIYNHENYYVNLQVLLELDEEGYSDNEEFEEELKIYTEQVERDTGMKVREEDVIKLRQKFEKRKHEERIREEEERLAREEEQRRLEKENPKKKTAAEKAEEAEQKRLEEEKAAAEAKKKKKLKKKKSEKKIEPPPPVEDEEKVQEPKKKYWQDLSCLSYDLSNLTHWEHLLPGEPYHRRQFIGVDLKDKRTAVDTEKHLDMPTSWVEKLDITGFDFEQRYPGFYKRIHYKRVTVEYFSRYSQLSGIVKRVNTYEDYALTKPILTYEFYNNRDDNMDSVLINHTKKEVVEDFETGRPDHLIRHTYWQLAPDTSIETYRTFEFKWHSRLDQLERIVCTPLTLEEVYRERADFLESRYMEYVDPFTKDSKRKLIRVTEEFRRNYAIEAKNDIWKKIFNLKDGTIDLVYQYAYNFVTNDRRQFIKPNLIETGGKILFDPAKTSGYIACPCALPPRSIDLYNNLCLHMEWEEETTKHVRDYEADMVNILKQRQKELQEPSLFVSLFNTERNEESKKAYFEMLRQQEELARREVDESVDPLQPYLARMFGNETPTRPLSIKDGALIREQCINDFKATMLARQVLVQDRFEKMNSEYKAKRLWYLANQFILSAEKEQAYFAMSAELSFAVHALEVRLTRHKDLSAPRFHIIEQYLNKHPLLAEYNKYRTYNRLK